ncbi:MmgE/PrpD family protein [Nitrosococcus watsonii]|uniref:MmgE/PrpD family protein n=1 Tax=Nitrosococcus watsoni (strain C-113) TaxID=105559 RepID=D8K688_NITWC|nr:MmgE/PrpD family protein [Nitrosococcus watsonii]ADJ28415.1 MmgE/PrpD family protein [Nitrosococcus watsonii C-113]
MTQVEQLAEFTSRASYQDLSEAARQQLKIRVLDSLTCGIGALEGEPIQMLRFYLYEVGGSGLCTLMATKERAAPARAAFYNGSLIRYLDYNDSYLAAGETCHPSDNLSAVKVTVSRRGISRGKRRVKDSTGRTVTLHNGRELVKEKQDYVGFHSRPMTWESIIQKYNQLTHPYAEIPLRRAIIHAVAQLEHMQRQEFG